MATTSLLSSPITATFLAESFFICSCNRSFSPFNSCNSVFKALKLDFELFNSVCNVSISFLESLFCIDIFCSSLIFFISFNALRVSLKDSCDCSSSSFNHSISSSFSSIFPDSSLIFFIAFFNSRLACVFWVCKAASPFSFSSCSFIFDKRNSSSSFSINIRFSFSLLIDFVPACSACSTIADNSDSNSDILFLYSATS